MPIRPIDPAKIVAASLGATPSSAKASASLIVARSRTRTSRPASSLGELRGMQTPDPATRSHHVVDRSGPNWDEDGEYRVGKGRPPVESRWRKGQSGNPRGPKIKEKLDPQTEFDRQVLKEFSARVNGEDVTLNLGTFALSLLKAGAAKGDRKSQELLMSLFRATLRSNVGGEAAPEVLAWEQETMDALLAEFGLPPKPVVRKTDRDVDSAGEEQ